MLNTSSILRKVQIVVAAIGMVVANTALAQNPSVSWGASANNFVEEGPASTDLLAMGSLVLIGTFDINMTAIQANQDPTFLFNHFATFGSSTIGTVTNQDGTWRTTTQRSTATTTLGSGTPFPVAGQRIYIWVFNGPTIAGSTEQGIFSLSSDASHTAPAPSWIFPTDNVVLNTTTIDLQDLTDGVSHSQLLANADVVIGGFSAERMNFETAPILVPEPSTYLLMTVGLGICSVWARRRNRTKA